VATSTFMAPLAPTARPGSQPSAVASIT
jgi:hypothetical protein